MSEIENTHLIRRVEAGETTYVLLGTAHVSPASVADVRREIATGDYDAVAVELCQSRYQSLMDPDALEKLDLFQVLRSGRAGMVMATLALGAYQQRLAQQFDIRPGEELKAAVEGARGRHLPVWLVDREIGTTLKRVYRSVPWWQRYSIFTGLIASLLSRQKVTAEDIERLKEGDILESTFNEFAAESRAMYRPLIEERDEYMAARLLEESDEATAGPPRRVLVVVGAGHLNGLEAHLREGIDDPVETRQALEEMPPPSRWPRLIPWAVVAVILTGFAIGFSRSPQLGFQLVGDWVLINGTLCALGVALARAHPLTIAGSFVAAPLTSLNPTVGAGMVAGAIEVMMRRPRVADFRELRDAVAHWSGWWHNRVARTLLVFLFAGIGSGIGTYLAGFRILGRLV
ncbi:TraB family protein [Spiribacter sp. 2438]|uniref:TraB/GumN family protein n=1 Tax=Spiribacter sp. 2438 TaxID=2666185 RepID=UPI0012AF24B6|nr:TraB/GumN family protein [Spiribacter sp. 2438]QGM21586.1 TraB family protein [Spiribacter sp. 2438]